MPETQVASFRAPEHAERRLSDIESRVHASIPFVATG
jgi:hypothetical protein